MTADRPYERGPSAATLLAAWDRACGEAPVHRAITLLASAAAEPSRDVLERLTLGDRDGRLLMLSESLFGRRISGLLNCPVCHEAMEIGFGASEVRVPERERPESSTVDVGGRAIQFRVPNTLDLVAAMEAEDVAGVRDVLVQRCILGVVAADGPCSADELDDAARDALSARMGDADPQANVDLAVTCPHCGHAWDAAFDVAAFLWMQVDAWAKRILRDVHALASAYGWSEDAILSMAASRRRLYLELVGG